MNILISFIFALTVSLDSFWVGLSYGIKGVRIPWYSLIMISLASSLMVLFSMLTGVTISSWLSPEAARRIGAVVLSIIGLFFLIQAYYPGRRPGPSREQTPPWQRITQILREPLQADEDASGSISLRESFMLGLALAVDSLGAGFGAAMAGLSPEMVPSLVGLFAAALLLLGLRAGVFLSRTWVGEKGDSLRGLILLALAIWEFR